MKRCDPRSTHPASRPSTRNRNRTLSGYSSSKTVKRRCTRVVSGGMRTSSPGGSGRPSAQTPSMLTVGGTTLNGKLAVSIEPMPSIVPYQSRPSRPMKPAGLPKFASATPRSAPSTTGATVPDPPIRRRFQFVPADDGQAPVGEHPHAPAAIVENARHRIVRQSVLDGQARDRAVAQAAQAASVAADPHGAVPLGDDVAHQPSRHALGRAEPA